MAKEILLTKGKVAIVDDEEFIWLSRFKWWYSVRGYAIRCSSRKDGKKPIYMHRVIINAPEGMLVDHINGNGLDNRKENLRLATKQQNTFNSSSFKNTSSKYKGVTWEKSRSLWRSQICINGKHKFIGFFKEEETAANAYNAYALKFHGEFVKLNNVSFDPNWKDKDISKMKRIISRKDNFIQL